MIESYARWLLRRRFAAVLITLVLAAVAASGMSQLEFTTDYRVFFSKENPQLRAFEALQNTYTKNDNVLFVLAPRNGNVFTPANLAAVERMTHEAWQIPYSIRVDSLTNYQHTRADGDDLIVADLATDAAQLSDAAIDDIRAVALAEPLLVNRLISPTGHVTGINVTIQLPGVNTDREMPEVVRFVREMADRARVENPEIDVYVTGVVMLNNAFTEFSMRDMQTLVPIMFAVVIASIALLLRVVSGTLATLIVIALSIATAMGLTGWLGIELSPPAATAPTIILTLAVADCVHILTSFLYCMRHGYDRDAAMVESMRINFQPVLLTSLTTAIGFLSMNFSDAPPFRDLGNIVAMGVLVAWALAVFFLPAAMAILPVRVSPGKTRGHVMMDRFAEFVIRRRTFLFWTSSVLVVILAVSITRNRLDDQFVEYFDETVAFRQASEFTTDNLTGLYTIDYSLRAGEPGGISDPAFLRKIDEFAQWYRAQPGVLHVYSITDIMRRLNKNMHGDDPQWYRIPEQRDLAAQYLLLYEMSLPFGLDLNNQINVDKSATRLNVTLESLSSNEVLNLEARAAKWLEQHAPASMQAEASSPAVMFSHIGQRNIRSMLFGTTVALLLISLCLVVAFRSPIMGLVSMVPNLVPAAMAFGVWGLLVGEVGLGISVVASMTLGIVVDDTIHFLSKYLRARREKGMGAPDAVRYAFASVGTALWVTSLVLIGGFLVLAASAFKINADMGLVTAITLALALAADFLLLPPLLIKLEERRNANAVGTVVDAAIP